VISGTLKRRGSAMALTCEMIATSTGDTLASPSGKVPLSESLIADDGFSFDNRARADGTPFEARVVEPVLDQAGRPNPLLKSDFPFRVEIYSVRPAAGETIGPKTRRVKKEFVPAKAGRAQAGAVSNELLISAQSGEIYEVFVTNRTDKRVGLALMIDGINTLGQRRERVENARLWAIEPGKTQFIDGWHVTAGAQSSGAGTEDLNRKRFVFTELAQSVAGRQQFGDALGTITAAFVEDRATRGLGTGEGEENLVHRKQVEILPGRLLGAVTIKYVDEDALRGGTQAAPSPPR
jgi:hypothetical protein